MIYCENVVECDLKALCAGICVAWLAVGLSFTCQGSLDNNQQEAFKDR
jgi:hypothetical protein